MKYLLIPIFCSIHQLPPFGLWSIVPTIRLADSTGLKSVRQVTCFCCGVGGRHVKGKNRTKQANDVKQHIMDDYDDFTNKD